MDFSPATREAPRATFSIAGWGNEPHWSVRGALLLTSLGLLTLEISLTRLFSFTIWYHFAYLTISVALLGFGASGAVVAAFPEVFQRHGSRLLIWGLSGASLLTIVALLIFVRWPLNVVDLTARPAVFSLALLGYYVAVGLPFLLAGFAVALPFAAYPSLMGTLYAWDLFGAALGCIFAVSGVEIFGVPGLVLAAAAFMMGAAAMLALCLPWRRLSLLLAAGALVSMGVAVSVGPRLDVHATATKGINGIGALRTGRDSFTRWTALNRVDAAGWAHPTKVSYWRGGAAKNYAGPMPDTAVIFYDGDNGSAIYSFAGSFDDYGMLDRHILRAPYLFLTRPRVLVLGVGGGIDMINAIKQGAQHVTGVELQPKTVALLKEDLRSFTGGFYDRPDVTLLAGEGRHFVRRTDDLFDLIQVTAVDTFAAQMTGAYVLAESYLYTVEAVEDYLGRLRDDGILSMVMGTVVYPNSLPPLATRLALTGYRALQRTGVARPSQHLMVLAAMNMRETARHENVLVKKSAFTADEVRVATAFAAANGFAVLYAPPLDTPSGDTLASVLGDDESLRQKVLDTEWFQMEAVHDNNPFFYNIARWASFLWTTHGPSLYFTYPGSFMGQLVLVLMLVQSTLLGLVLILFPLLRGARGGLRTPNVASALGFFLALGIGFMFVEISFVQKFVLFLGSPTHALSVTIFALLLFASLGSLMSRRWAAQPESALRRLALFAAALVLLYTVGLTRVFEAFLHLRLGWRIVLAVLVQFPIGLTLGMFMPLGVILVSRRHPRLVPWAWGINGVGSVLGTTLAVIIAMSWGFTVVSVAAAVLYGLGTELLIRAETG